MRAAADRRPARGTDIFGTRRALHGGGGLPALGAADVAGAAVPAFGAAADVVGGRRRRGSGVAVPLPALDIAGVALPLPAFGTAADAVGRRPRRAADVVGGRPRPRSGTAMPLPALRAAGGRPRRGSGAAVPRAVGAADVRGRWRRRSGAAVLLPAVVAGDVVGGLCDVGGDVVGAPARTWCVRKWGWGMGLIAAHTNNPK